MTVLIFEIIVMLTAGKHLTVFCNDHVEMFHFVQHDSAYLCNLHSTFYNLQLGDHHTHDDHE